MNFWRDLQGELDARAAKHLTRELKNVPDGALDLASNDYLGLARHPEVIEAAQRAAAQFGTGARASRLVSGSYALIEELERELARFKNTESALVFSSGYAANVGTITALANQQSALFCHKRNHASLLDACKLSGAPTRFFEGADKLRALLEISDARRKIIVCDGVFSMDGDLCDLPVLVELADEFDALILLDDAHGTGTLGATGRGTVEQCARSLKATAGSPADECAAAREDGLRVREDARRRSRPSAVDFSLRLVTLGTLSKALGSQGGFVCGPRVLMDYLVGAARSFVYSTGLNPPAAGAALAALRIVEREPERVQQCRDNAALLARELTSLGLEVGFHGTPIVPVFAADSSDALRMSARLAERGLWCPPIRPPTVKRPRLRLTSSAGWDEATLARIVEAFAGKP